VFEVRYPGESGGCQAESAALPALMMLAEDAEAKYGDNRKWSGTLKGCSGLRHTWSEVAGSLSGRSGLRLIHLPPTVQLHDMLMTMTLQDRLRGFATAQPVISRQLS